MMRWPRHRETHPEVVTWSADAQSVTDPDVVDGDRTVLTPPV
jgi:hypothetical protein